MATTKTGGAHGIYKVLAQLTGPLGPSYGQAGHSMANGTTSAAYVLNHPKSFGVAVPDPTTIDFTGGDRWITSYQYGINSLGSFSMTTQDRDSDYIALSTGTLADTTSNTEWVESTEDMLSQGVRQQSLMGIHRIQSFAPATFGQTFYINSIIPRAWVRPKGYASQYQTAADYEYNVTPASSSRKITGEAFGAALNATDNRVAIYHLITEYPLMMVAHRCNGTSATIVAPYKPITSAVGTVNATKNRIVKFVESTGVATLGVADTVTVATGSFAVGTALSVASGDMLFVLYETAYEPV